MKRTVMAELEKTAERILGSSRCPEETKAELRGELNELKSRMRKVERDLGERSGIVEDRLSRAELFWRQLRELGGWISQIRRQLDEYNQAVLYTPMKIDPNVNFFCFYCEE